MRCDPEHSPATGSQGTGVSLVIGNARVFDGQNLLTADTVAVTDGAVAAVGSRQDVLAALDGKPVEEFDAAGALLTPGFVDAHVHTVFGGLERLGCDLSETEGREQCLRAVADFAARNEGGEWISGGGWTMSDFPGGTPLATDLDTAVPHRPVYLINRDHHSAWVNSAALRRAGVTAATPDPVGGRIERDETGNPTGTLHESAMELVGDLLPPETDAQLRRGLAEGQRYLHSFGITGWQDAIVGRYSGHGDPFDAYRAADAAGELSAEVVGALWWPRDVEDIAAQVRTFADRRRQAGRGRRFRATAVKFMLDGIVESRTAALAEPYHSCGCPGSESGVSYFEPEFLAAAFTALDAAGFDIHLHAIGDRAVSQGLDALAAARRADPDGDGRHHIAHLQVVDPRDIPRFAELDVTANLQALWACNDDAMVELNRPALGPALSAWQYPFAALQRAGAALAMGSDWPVSTPDPWQAIHTAVTRTEAGVRQHREALNPDQALDLLDALRAYTSGSARLNRSPSGRIRVGEPANLALTDRDPFTGSPEELANVTVRLTLADGRIVHEGS